MLHITKVEMRARDKHSNLFDWYVSYDENKTPDMLVNNEGCMQDKKKSRQQVVKNIFDSANYFQTLKS